MRYKNVSYEGHKDDDTLRQPEEPDRMVGLGVGEYVIQCLHLYWQRSDPIWLTGTASVILYALVADLYLLASLESMEEMNRNLRTDVENYPSFRLIVPAHTTFDAKSRQVFKPFT